jgi:hypothetical protein
VGGCACAALLAVLPGGARGAPGVELSVLLESDTAWRVHSPRVAQKSQNRLEVDLELRLSDALSVRGLGRLLWDPAGRLVGPDPDFGQEPLDRGQVGGSRHLEAELRELYADWRGRVGAARLDVRVGKQQVVWGQSFGLRVLDVVNAQDFREFILDEFVDARTPTWGVRADAFVRGLSLQALVFPDFEPDALPDPESEFALDPALRGLLPALAVAPSGGPLVALADPAIPDDWKPGNWGVGVRVGGHLRGFDLALHYWDRLDPRGVFRRRIVPVPVRGAGTAPLNVLERDFVRVHTLGFSFSTAFGDVTLWGEGGLSLGRAFVVNDLGDDDGVVHRPDLEYALGLDWTGWEPLFANVQFIQLVILDHERAIDLDPTRQFLSVLLRFDLRGETLFPQLFVLYGTNENESLIRPSLEWRASDRLSVSVGADLFTGPREGLLGQFAGRRECVPLPSHLPLPGSGGCLFDPPPGRTSRVFLRFRYEFAWHP